MHAVAQVLTESPGPGHFSRMVLRAANEVAGKAPSGASALVFGTGYGPLGATEEFLTGVKTRGMGFGSPTAFHTSVHHAVLGQLALSLKHTGVQLSVSSREVSGEAALAAAVRLLKAGRAESVLVLAGDEVTGALVEAYEAFGLNTVAVGVPSEGAGAAWLSKEPSDLNVEVAFTSASAGGLKWPGLSLPDEGLMRPVFELPSNEVGFNPSGGMLRFVQSVDALRADAKWKTAVVRGAAFGGAQGCVTLRREAKSP